MLLSFFDVIEYGYGGIRRENGSFLIYEQRAFFLAPRVSNEKTRNQETRKYVFSIWGRINNARNVAVYLYA